MILSRYVANRFWTIIVFSLATVIILFVAVDLVENLDGFIDRNVPWKDIFLFYFLGIPNIVVLTMPVAVLLSTMFTLGLLARHNEIVAMKALGYSFYQVLKTILLAGLLVSIAVFFLSEIVAVKANKDQIAIKQRYWKSSNEARLEHLFLQEPPNQIITITRFEPSTQEAFGVEIAAFNGNRLIWRIDAPLMKWDGRQWIINSGVRREFLTDIEKVDLFENPIFFHFRWTPNELASSQIKPDEMDILSLKRFISRVGESGGKVHRWKTDLYSRIAFPFSSLIIILLSTPLAYNMRKKNLAVGFGMSLAICFVYFGVMKIGQTMGHGGQLGPCAAAWLGNTVMTACGVGGLVMTRK
jgi:lipopolysaccharide export system permease protein